jgi:phosphopantetheine--protein transferase-like protein
MKTPVVYGCGNDIEQIARFRKILKNPDKDAFIADVFTDREIEQNGKVDPAIRFALGFCLKESVFKSFGMSWVNSPITWKDVELHFLSDSHDTYDINLYGFARELYYKNGIRKIETDLKIESHHVYVQVILIK